MREMIKPIFVFSLSFCISALCLDAHAASGTTALTDAEKMFLEGKYDNVVREAEGIVSSRTSQSEKAYYLMGLSQLKLGRFEDARKTFEAVKSKFPGSRRVFDADMGIGDSYFLEGNMERAISVYNDILYKYPDDKNIAVIYYRLGASHKNMGLNDKADEYFAKLKRIAPLSFESKMAGTGVNIVSTRSNSNSRIIKPDNIGPARQDPVVYTQEKPASSGQAVLPQDKNMIIYLDSELCSVQMGSFKSKWNAIRFTKGLSSKGYDAYMEEENSGKSKIYKVKIGKGITKEEAQALSEKLRRKGYKTKICNADES